MAAPLHKELAQGRWLTFSLMEQLGNIGSEVSRAVHWQKKGNHLQRDSALERALELFDLTVADMRWRHRLKELTRAREIVRDVFYGDNVYHVTPEALEKYFFEFAYAARLRR